MWLILSNTLSLIPCRLLDISDENLLSCFRSGEESVGDDQEKKLSTLKAQTLVQKKEKRGKVFVLFICVFFKKKKVELLLQCVSYSASERCLIGLLSAFSLS